MREMWSRFVPGQTGLSLDLYILKHEYILRNQVNMILLRDDFRISYTANLLLIIRPIRKSSHNDIFIN